MRFRLPMPLSGAGGRSLAVAAALAACALAALGLAGGGGRTGPETAAPHLVARGQLVWRDPAPGFGGLSGLAVAADGTRVTVLSDRARLFAADIRRDPGTGAPLGFGPARGQALLNAEGRNLSPFNSDAEDLAPGPGGSVIVAFEGLTRVVAYPGAAPAQSGGAGRIAHRLHAWDRFAARFGNTGFEALAPLPGGGLLAIGEAAVPGVDPGPGPPAFAFSPADGQRDGEGQWRRVFDIPDPAGFAVSGADLGPDGRLWLLERRLGRAGFVTRIRRFALTGVPGGPEGPEGAAPGLALGPAETLLEARLGLRDNYEGIAVWCDPAGRIIATLVSDDGFSLWQRNVLSEFVLVRPGPPRDGSPGPAATPDGHSCRP